MAAVEDQKFQLWCELFRFRLPVRNQGRWADYQGRRFQPAGRLLNLNARQGLQGFAQAHVVCQYAPEAKFPQKLQPVEAILLVMAEPGIEFAGRQYVFQSLEAGQFSAQRLEFFTAVPVGPGAAHDLRCVESG